MSKLVKQVLSNGDILIDYDKKVRNNMLRIKLLEIFDNVDFDNRQYIINNKISLLFSNITYLGHPHPINKKRFQLKPYYLDYFLKNIKNGLITFYVGVYSYNKDYIYCVISASEYKNYTFNNTSIHVSVEDLQLATYKGVHKKNDKNFNNMYIFDEKYFCSFINTI